MASRALFAAMSVLVLAGCGRKAEGQTVAVVNGAEVTLPELNYELGNTNIPQGADQKAVRAQILQRLVDRNLLVQEARNEGLDKTPEFINRERRSTEDLLISMLSARLLKTVQVPSEKEISDYVAAHPGMFADRELWSLQQLVYQQPVDKQILTEIENAHSMQQLETVLQKHNIQFVRQAKKLDTALVPSDLFGRISTLPAGEPFIFPVSGRAVASVIVARERAPLTGDAAKPVAVAAIRKDRSVTLVSDRVKALRSKAKIEYKPGFEAPKEGSAR